MNIQIAEYRDALETERARHNQAMEFLAQKTETLETLGDRIRRADEQIAALKKRLEITSKGDSLKKDNQADQYRVFFINIVVINVSKL